MRTIARVVYSCCAGMLAGCANTATSPPLRDALVTTAAPAPVGPYSQAMRFGNLLFVSGQLAVDAKTGNIKSGMTVENQTRLVMENLKAVLQANGMTLDDALMTTVYLRDLKDFPTMNKVYGGYFKKSPPARVTVGVADLARDAKVEIAMIAGK
jgi:2-iminobutanoate/2-iminopropanoate deaminase